MFGRGVDAEFTENSELIAGMRMRVGSTVYDGSVATDYQRYLDETVARLGLERQVRFRGGMPHAELPAAYRAADLVVNPALSESFGIAVVEGMACGRPVVGTRVGGMLETVACDATGLLVPAEEPARLAGAMLTLLRDPVRAGSMGERGRERAVEHYWK